MSNSVSHLDCRISRLGKYEPKVTSVHPNNAHYPSIISFLSALQHQLPTCCMLACGGSALWF